jgi:toxin ParE1/3/4
MISLPYIISNEAIADLNKIWYYTVEKWSVAQANHYYDLIFQEIDYICKRPHSGKPLDDIRKGYRVSKVKSHLIFYKVVNGTIEIIRILHQRMDIENRLSE